jgi:hypothetical protein
MSVRSAVIAATPLLVSVPLPVSAPSAPGRICKESQAVDANPKGARHDAGKQLSAADHHVTE